MTKHVDQQSIHYSGASNMPNKPHLIKVVSQIPASFSLKHQPPVKTTIVPNITKRIITTKATTLQGSSDSDDSQSAGGTKSHVSSVVTAKEVKWSSTAVTSNTKWQQPYTVRESKKTVATTTPTPTWSSSKSNIVIQQRTMGVDNIPNIVTKTVTPDMISKARLVRVVKTSVSSKAPIVHTVKGTVARSSAVSSVPTSTIQAVATPASIEESLTVSSSKETVMRCLQKLENKPLPIAVPLMVNKMIESVLCEESSGDEASVKSSDHTMTSATTHDKLQCNESLDFDDDVNNSDAQAQKTVQISAANGHKPRDSESVVSKPKLPIRPAAKSQHPALTFSQIQEKLIRKAMEDTGPPPKEVTSSASHNPTKHT